MKKSNYVSAIFVAFVFLVLFLTGCEPATRSEWPGIVMLFRGRSFICGGVLVAPDIVLTARHCSESRPDRIAVGRSNRSATDGTEYMIVDSCRTDPDPDGVCAKLHRETDLELHQLDRPVPVTEAQVARLAIEAEYNPENAFYALGWAGGDGTLRVERIETFLQPPSVCINYTPPPGSWICAEGPILQSTDSGGPLYVAVGDERALIGIASSTGRRRPGDTGPEVMDFWQRVPSYLSEIPGIVGPIGSGSWELSACEIPLRSSRSWCDSGKHSFRRADFNGDTYDDLIAVGPSERMRIWLSRPTGGFSENPQSFPSDLEGISFWPTFVVGEFDDNRGVDLAGIDLVGGESGMQLRVLVNGGDNTWDDASYDSVDLTALDPSFEWWFEDEATAYNAHFLRVGNVNADEYDDLLVMLDSRAYVFENQRGTGWHVIDPGIPAALFTEDPGKRQTMLLADVVPDSIGLEGSDEIVLRDECGLRVYQRLAAGTWVMLLEPACTEGSLSDENGWNDVLRRTTFAAGNFNDDTCQDILVRDWDRVRIFLSNCAAGESFRFDEAPDPLAYWYDSFGDPYSPPFRGWSRAVIQVGDIDDDGLDDFIGESYFGVETRLNRLDGMFMATDPFQPVFESSDGATVMCKLPEMILGDFDGSTTPGLQMMGHITTCGLDLWTLR